MARLDNFDNLMRVRYWWCWGFNQACGSVSQTQQRQLAIV